jgi:hypothetical protein
MHAAHQQDSHDVPRESCNKFVSDGVVGAFARLVRSRARRSMRWKYLSAELLVRSHARCVRGPVSGVVVVVVVVVVVGGAFARPVPSRARQRGCYWCVRAPGAFARPVAFMTGQGDKRPSCSGLKPRR